MRRSTRWWLTTRRCGANSPSIPNWLMNCGRPCRHCAKWRATFIPRPAPTSGLPEVPGYAVEGELGIGGMGTVFKAQQTSLKRTVALKMMWKHGLGIRSRDERFRAEAEVVAQLEHPHIVQIYETGETGAARYLVLEYMSGGTLAARLAGRPQPERWAAEALATITQAVAYAHGAGSFTATSSRRTFCWPPMAR